MTLITEDYRQLNARQHALHDSWGRHSSRYAHTIATMASRIPVTEMLDYGCGKQELKRALEPEFTVHGYDPAFEELSAPPEPHDLVVCTDVLEHIEPECLDAVLTDLRRLTRKFAFLVIADRPSLKPLPDGTNPHRIIQPKAWWIEQLERHGFDVLDNGQVPKYFSLVVR